jgi:hypothetical protein
MERHSRHSINLILELISSENILSNMRHSQILRLSSLEIAKYQYDLFD